MLMIFYCTSSTSARGAPNGAGQSCSIKAWPSSAAKGLNGSTYWPKNKASPVQEEDEDKEVQGAVGGQMYTGQLASVFSGFQ